MIYYLFAGPETDAPGSFTSYCSELNAEVRALDTLIGGDAHDLIQPENWLKLKQELKDEADGALLSPPCGSFSGSRNDHDGGPRPLRGCEGAEIYGLQGLDPEEKETVRVGTACMVRTAEAALIVLGKEPWQDELGDDVWPPVLVEQPMPRPCCPSGYLLPEMQVLDRHRAVGDSDIAQCPLGAKTVKKTRLKGSVKIVAASSCPHKKRWWRTPWNGKWHYGAHPPLKGKQWAIPSEKWRPSMLRPYSPKGPYLTKASAAYPHSMNKLLAIEIVGQARKCKRAKMRLRGPVNSTTAQPSPLTLPGGDLRCEKAPSGGQGTLPGGDLRCEKAPSGGQGPHDNALPQPAQPALIQATMEMFGNLTKCGKWKNALVNKSQDAVGGACTDHNEQAIYKGLTSDLDLRGGRTIVHKAMYEAERLAIGGLRNTADTMSRLGSVREFGKRFRAKLDGWIEAVDGFESRCLSLIGLEGEELKRALAVAKPDFDKIKSWASQFLETQEPRSRTASRTCIDGPFLRSWSKAAGDPGANAVEWLDGDGAPAGLSVDFKLDGIWPSVDPEASEDVDELLRTDYDGFVNYAGFDEDEDAYQELWAFVATGKLLAYRTREECKAAIGAEPLLSRFGLLIKWRDGKCKKRVILDCKQSGLSKRTRRRYKVMLPRVTDAVRDALKLLANRLPLEQLEIFILDFKDAFWSIPLHGGEKRWFCGRVRGWWLVYNAVAQGSRNGPLAWCTIAALLARLTQGLFDPLREMRLQVYVDDPAATICGTAKHRDRVICIMILVWVMTGFELALAKAKRGSEVTWIGSTISVCNTSVQVSIPEDKARDVLNLTQEIENGNVVSAKVLRTYAGKTNSIASVIDVMRPFVSDAYGALKSIQDETNSNAPRNCIWSRQVSSTTTWIRLFLQRQKGSIVRIFPLSTFLDTGIHVTIRMDASPWGLGAVLFVEHQVKAWIACALDKHDCEILKIVLGDCASQQTAECLIQLVSLRAWKAIWQKPRVILTVSSDNMTSLHLVDNFKASGPSINLIAREVALEYGDSTHRPSRRSHCPGVANKLADTLSRRYQPQKTFALPQELSKLTETQVQTRDESYYLTRAGAKPDSAGDLEAPSPPLR